MDLGCLYLILTPTDVLWTANHDKDEMILVNDSVYLILEGIGGGFFKYILSVDDKQLQDMISIITVDPEPLFTSLIVEFEKAIVVAYWTWSVDSRLDQYDDFPEVEDKRDLRKRSRCAFKKQ